MHTKFQMENLKERAHLEDTGIDETVTLKTDLKEMGYDDSQIPPENMYKHVPITDQKDVGNL